MLEANGPASKSLTLIIENTQPKSRIGKRGGEEKGYDEGRREEKKISRPSAKGGYDGGVSPVRHTIKSWIDG